MKIVVLGAGGMLGHRLLRVLADRGHEVVGTVRKSAATIGAAIGTSRPGLIGDVSVERDGAVEHVLDQELPDVAINCIGVVKQLASAKDPLVSIPVNALFPHRLSQACGERGIRLIHFSTDCVFSGDAGPYSETSHPDPRDLYGRTKLLGEVNAAHALTLRTSIIGPEPGDGAGLLSWVLRSRGKKVSGFARALYTGVTTDFMADAIQRLIEDFPDLCGVWHLSADPISKYDLIRLVDELYGLNLTIERDESFVCDRRLDSSLLRSRTGIVPPTWADMLRQMHDNHRQV